MLFNLLVSYNIIASWSHDELKLQVLNDCAEICSSFYHHTASAGHTELPQELQPVAYCKPICPGLSCMRAYIHVVTHCHQVEHENSTLKLLYDSICSMFIFMLLLLMLFIFMLLGEDCMHACTICQNYNYDDISIILCFIVSSCMLDRYLLVYTKICYDFMHVNVYWRVIMAACVSEYTMMTLI